MVFDKSKKNQTATKVADNLNDLCKKLNTAIQRKKDLKASKLVDIYDKCCVLRSQLEGLATKLLDSGNTREFEYVANISHTSSKILSNYEKLTSRPSYQPSLTNYSSLNTLNLTSNSGNLPGQNIQAGSLETNVNVSTFDGGNSMGSFEDNYGSGGNMNEIPGKVSRQSSQSDWAKFDTVFDNNEKTPLSTVAKEGYKTPSAREGYDQGERSGSNSRSLKVGKEGDFRDERRYKKDYLDTNMDASVDYFNTSLDLHNKQDDYYDDEFDDYEHEEEEEEEEFEGYPSQMFYGQERMNERGRRRKTEERGYRMSGKKMGMAERQPSASESKRVSVGVSSGVGGNRVVGTGRARVGREVESRMSGSKPGTRLDTHPGVHDRDHTSDRYREQQVGGHKYKEGRGMSGYPREQGTVELESRYESVKEGKEGARADFIVKTKLKRTTKGEFEEQKNEEVSESEKDMAEYIKMLEKFLQLTKFNSVINRLNEHEDDYKTKLSSLQSYYHDTYDGLEATTTQNTGVGHLGGVGGHSEGVVKANASIQMQGGEGGDWRSPQVNVGEGYPRGASQVAIVGGNPPVSPGKQAYKDETKLFGKEIEPLWRSESDGGLSNYLGDFLLTSDYRLIKTNKYEVHLDINQLNRDDFVLNMQLYFVAKINIASLNMNYINLNEGMAYVSTPTGAAKYRSGGIEGGNSTNNFGGLGAGRLSIGQMGEGVLMSSGRSGISSGGRMGGSVITTANNANLSSYPSRLRGSRGLSGGIMLVDERPLAKENNLTINLKVDLTTVIDFPVLQIKLIENDGNKSELRLLLPVGIFLSLVPLKYKLNQFEAFWNSMELTVNRQIRLFLSKMPVDLNNLINLLWKYFSVYLQEDVLLLSSCGTEVLLGSIFIKQGTLVVVQLRSICNALITSTMNMLKELFSSLSVKYDPNISNYTLKRVSSLPLNFQSNVQLNAVVKSIANYK
ncbi:hypothetical protein MACK_002498 [Theileria orientalis]|uniref:Uncharacterized protein n=1 Tax=Theileria orientalis TaxID=68886 RepID=A0A976QTP8_THEOR|nr:hypothetical protein MACK_002498 [Theileria orientalis]